MALGCNEDCKHLCYNSLLAKARNYLGGKNKAVRWQKTKNLVKVSKQTNKKENLLASRG